MTVERVETQTEACKPILGAKAPCTVLIICLKEILRF